MIAVREHEKLLRASAKFMSWEPVSAEDALRSLIAAERHYSPQELSKLWGVSVHRISFDTP
jgi:hypothetical protein